MTRAALILSALLALPAPALAEDNPVRQVMDAATTDANVRALIGAALGIVQHARCGAEACAPATEEERQRLPFSQEQAQAVVREGVRDGFRSWFGALDRDRAADALGRTLHERDGLDVRAAAILVTVHEIAVESVEGSLRDRGACPDALSAGIAAPAK